MGRNRTVPSRSVHSDAFSYLPDRYVKAQPIRASKAYILCIRSKKAENLEKKIELWIYLKQKDFKTFMKIRYGILGQTMNIPGRPGRKISSLAYSVARRIIGFN